MLANKQPEIIGGKWGLNYNLMGLDKDILMWLYPTVKEAPLFACWSTFQFNTVLKYHFTFIWYFLMEAISASGRGI